MQTLIPYLWGGTSRLPGDHADALGCLSVTAREARSLVMGCVLSKVKAASVSIRKVLA